METNPKLINMDIKRLIHLVEERPELYANRHENRTNRGRIEELWREIASLMGFSDAECRCKWMNLKNSLSRELRHQRSVDGKIRKQWFLFDRMKFMLPYVSARQVYEKGEYSDEDTVVVYDVTERKPDITSFCQEENSPCAQVVDMDTDSNSHPKTSVRRAEIVRQPTESMVKVAHLKTMDDSHHRSDVKSTLVVNDNKHSETVDEDLMFFKSLLPEIKSLPSREKRMFKLKVHQLLFELSDSFYCPQPAEIQHNYVSQVSPN